MEELLRCVHDTQNLPTETRGDRAQHADLGRRPCRGSGCQTSVFRPHCVRIQSVVARLHEANDDSKRRQTGRTQNGLLNQHTVLRNVPNGLISNSQIPMLPKSLNAIALIK